MKMLLCTLLPILQLVMNDAWLAQKQVFDVVDYNAPGGW
jgi:hypothetical protein